MLSARSLLLLALLVVGLGAGAYLAGPPAATADGLRRGDGADTGSSGSPALGPLVGSGARASSRAEETATTVDHAAPRRPHGLLVTERRDSGEGGLGIPAVDVDLLVDGRWVARATTAATGAFELDAEVPPSVVARVRPRPDPRYRFVPREIALTPAQAAGEVPIELFGRHTEAAPWNGRVVDARTGEPVPFFLLHVFDALGGDERIETEADGRFATLQSFGPGRMTLRLADFEGSRGRYGFQALERDDVHAVSDVRVRVGPTYRVRVVPPAGHGLTDFVAHVVPPGTRRPASLDRAASSRLRTGGAGRSREGAGSDWVRLHPSETPEGTPGPWELVLVSDDGAWRGSALVDSLEGIYPEVVAIALEPQGRVRGRVEDEEGAAVAGLALSLAPLASGPRAACRTDREGRFELPAVPAGEYVLTSAGRAHLPFQETVTVVHGEDCVLRLVARARPVAGALRGRVVTESGRDGEACGVSFEQDGFEVAGAQVEWSGGVGLFELVAVPDGEGRLSLQQYGAVVPVEPAALAVRAPAADLSFTLRDDVPRVTLVFEVRDAETDALLAGGHQLWCSALGLTFGSELADVPLLADLEWGVRAQGHAPVFGRLEDLAGEGATRVVQVRARAGWGARLVAVHADEGRALRGLVLELDGEPLEPTDAAGVTFAYRAARPARLGVATPGRTLAGGAVNVVSGRFADFPWFALAVHAR